MQHGVEESASVSMDRYVRKQCRECERGEICPHGQTHSKCKGGGGCNLESDGFVGQPHNQLALSLQSAHNVPGAVTLGYNNPT